MTKRRDALKDYLAPITPEFSAENPPPRPRPHVASGALQSMNDAISGLSSEAEGLRRRLSEGQVIVEIDPDLIDASIVKDRLDSLYGPEIEALAESIGTSGQILPVLVRPHPGKKGRYQLAFGHRRVAAIKRLGGTVKAVVRELTDDELIIAQGNENLERKDLSFIEKALFAFRLEEMGIARAVIMTTFGTNSKGVLSEMISLVRKLPSGLIEAIGAAAGIGRPRWESLANKIGSAKQGTWKAVVTSPDFQELSSADRFERLARSLEKTAVRRTSASGTTAPWTAKDKSVSVTLKSSGKKAVLTYQAADGPNFAHYIAERLDDLFEDFQKSAKSSTGV